MTVFLLVSLYLSWLSDVQVKLLVCSLTPRPWLQNPWNTNFLKEDWPRYILMVYWRDCIPHNWRYLQSRHNVYFLLRQYLPRFLNIDHIDAYSLYFAYLQRPLQAWSYINTTAARCRLLLSYGSSNSPDENECLRRIFWSCYILERLSPFHSLRPTENVTNKEQRLPCRVCCSTWKRHRVYWIHNPAPRPIQHPHRNQQLHACYPFIPTISSASDYSKVRRRRTLLSLFFSMYLNASASQPSPWHAICSHDWGLPISVALPHRGLGTITSARRMARFTSWAI